jgi:hypothetical protein
MTDPRRIAEGGGFAAQLLRAGAAEQPGAAGLERTLAALGVSGAVLSSTLAVSAAAAGGKMTSAASGGAAALSTGTLAGGAGSAASVALVAKWIGIGLIGGVSFAGAASVVTQPAPPSPRAADPAPPMVTRPPSDGAKTEPAPVVVDTAPATEPSLVSPAPPLRRSAIDPPSLAAESDLGLPLSAEVAFVDRARALLRQGRTRDGLSLLEGYENEFREARLLPEVLFLRLEACERLGRVSDARRVAERLLAAFPKSPHAARARKLLAD